MVNINIEVPDELHRQAKIAATLDGKTLKRYLIERLEQQAASDLERAEGYP